MSIAGKCTKPGLVTHKFPDWNNGECSGCGLRALTSRSLECGHWQFEVAHWHHLEDQSGYCTNQEANKTFRRPLDVPWVIIQFLPLKMKCWNVKKDCVVHYYKGGLMSTGLVDLTAGTDVLVCCFWCKEAPIRQFFTGCNWVGIMSGAWTHMDNVSARNLSDWKELT